jgi:hypothetical protein
MFTAEDQFIYLEHWSQLLQWQVRVQHSHIGLFWSQEHAMGFFRAQRWLLVPWVFRFFE